MRTIEVKMHYTFLGFFKFFYYFGWKYLFVPHFIIMYILSFFIDSLAFFIRNGIAHLIAYFILATFCSPVKSFAEIIENSLRIYALFMSII